MKIVRKRKYFNDNQSYFNFINKMKDKIKIKLVNVTDKNIKLEYEVK